MNKTEAEYSDRKFKPIRVLHVDDEPTDLEITRIFLQRASKNAFEIVSVLSAEEALDRLKTEHFDTVISDYQMPGMDGIAFLEVLRSSREHALIPFILFTGKGGARIAAEALKKGADRYITKSGNPASQCNELADTIKGLLGWEVTEDERWRIDEGPLKVAVADSQCQLV
ncbi:MAG: response regulator [Methanomicrobia archaeon]|nr:response regulator [Methanomicrobia archaeon]